MICVNCGIEVWSMTARKFCGDKCRKAHWGKTAVGREAARRGNAKKKRPDIDKVCAVCGSGFTTARKTQQVCGKCTGTPPAAAFYAKQYTERNETKVAIRTTTGAMRAEFT